MAQWYSTLLAYARPEIWSIPWWGTGQGRGGYVPPLELECLSSEAAQAETTLEVVLGYVHLLNMILSCLGPDICDSFMGMLLGQSLFGDSQDPEDNFATFFFLLQ